ncbi:C40 family peptidase [Pseudonocardia sp. TRM90224]|uniref:C40 family peptidase n=1 Tax=Pseudonocardia sp. TRM90224 TaxID=2812678 RepID=UPI001E3BE3F0|nr:C40 family peptidase [Pseudonocardia sp. TRM90224]
MPGAADLDVAARPRRRLAWALLLVALAALFSVTGLVTVVVTVAAYPSSRSGCIDTVSPTPQVTGRSRSVPSWDADQQANAQIIAAVGRQLGAPQRAIWIGLATAMQESVLRNLDHGHADSVGLFQQRPSQGWGTVAQLTDPAHAAHKFFIRLLAIPGWDGMPLTQAAQKVQRSAFPEAYAQWEQPAADLLAQIGGTAATGQVCRPSSQPSGQPSGAAATAIKFARAQLGKPYDWGATGPDTFDCSGLIMRSWQAAGVQLPRVSRAQTTAGQRLPLDQVQPGDLVFWSTTGRADDTYHVAMYLGDGQIIEAATTGVPVRERALSLTEHELLPFALRPTTPGSA